MAPPPPAPSHRPESRTSYLSAQPQQDEHEEEEQGPEWGDGQQCEGLWVCHEGQARAVVCHAVVRQSLNPWPTREVPIVLRVLVYKKRVLDLVNPEVLFLLVFYISFTLLSQKSA